MLRFNKVLLLLVVGMAVLLLSCTDAPVGGSSTEEGNPQIVAFVIDKDNLPVSGIPVTAFRTIAYNDSITAPSAATEIATKLTGMDGRCTFDSLTEGTYSLQASDKVNKRSALLSPITIGSDAGDEERADTLILDQSGGINGVVSRGGVGGFVSSQNVNLQDAAIMVIVQEISLSFITSQDGSYSFPQLPEGTYTVIYYATDGFFSAKQSITVHAGEVTAADTVILNAVPRLLPPDNFFAIYDTAESTVYLSWDQLDYDSLRWYEVVRIDTKTSFDSTFITTETHYTDLLTSLPSGTVLHYVIHSVDKAFNESSNAGPVEITVK